MISEEIIKKFELQKKTWTFKGFHGILHYFFPVGEMPIQPLREYFGDAHNITVFYFENNLGHWYWNNEDMVRLRNALIDRVNKDPKFLDELLGEWHRRLRAFDAIMKKIDVLDFSSLSNSELMDWYEKWYDLYIKEFSISIGLQDPFSMHASDFLEPYLKKVLGEKGVRTINETYILLLSSVDRSFIGREYDDRLRILEKIQAGKGFESDEIEMELETHTKKYHWIQNNYAADICLTKEHFRNELKSILPIDAKKEIEKIKCEGRELKEKKKKLIEELHLDSLSKNFIRITEIFAYMQDERKKYVLIANHYQNIFLKEVQRRLNIDRKHIEYTFIKELRGLLQQRNIDTKIFEKRKEGVMVIHTRDGFEFVEGEEAKKIFHEIFAYNAPELDEFSGTIASAGQAQGMVKIVHKKHDLVNFSEGDILVATMTRPEMVIAMKKAAAIVTDEGGITSHAAVVSRELGIPCIIGTKIATKVLKDGDLVEVDAERGIVKILS